MKRKIIWLGFMLAPVFIYAQDITREKLWKDSVEATFAYQHGEIKLPDELGTVTVPKGFKYLDGTQAERVIKDLWGNPDGSGTFGILLPQDMGIMDAWAFIITYDDMGYVKDEDADEIDYDEMLGQLQKETLEANLEREKQGYEKITLVGWASKPYYDKETKTLHWAKELKFGDQTTNTLNYNVRILGRKGVLMLNAVASVDELTPVQKSIDNVQASVQFSDGKKYSDFNPDIDEVAAWTIGGLVAGKVLAKIGFFAIFLKYIKFIGLGLAAIGGYIWNWLRGKKNASVVASEESQNTSGQG